MSVDGWMVCCAHQVLDGPPIVATMLSTNVHGLVHECATMPSLGCTLEVVPDHRSFTERDLSGWHSVVWGKVGHALAFVSDLDRLSSTT